MDMQLVSQWAALNYYFFLAKKQYFIVGKNSLVITALSSQSDLLFATFDCTLFAAFEFDGLD